MMTDYNRLQQILELSGGKLSNEKNTYYALNWDCSMGGKSNDQYVCSNGFCTEISIQ
jgi:hypothetical protein